MTKVDAEGMRNKRSASIIKKAEVEWIPLLATMFCIAQAPGQIDAQVDARQPALFIAAVGDRRMIRQAFLRQLTGVGMNLFFDAILIRQNKRDRLNRSADTR